MLTIQTVKRGTPLLVRQWSQSVVAAGGGFTSNSLVIASRLVQVLQTKSYYPKIKYLLPLLGSGINAARVPLLDTFVVGAATNVNFVNADFSQATGLTGDGATKYLDLLVSPLTLGTIAGVGFWNMAVITGGDYRCGATNGGESLRYVVDLRTISERFSWGASSNQVISGNPAIAAHYYGQQANTSSRILYRNAISVGSNTNTDSNSPVSNTMFLMAGDIGGSPGSWATGACGLFYMTDGSLSDGDIADFHSTLSSYLMAPTGRI